MSILFGDGKRHPTGPHETFEHAGTFNVKFLIVPPPVGWQPQTRFKYGRDCNHDAGSSTDKTFERGGPWGRCRFPGWATHGRPLAALMPQAASSPFDRAH